MPALGGLTSPVSVVVKRAVGPCFAAHYGFPPALDVTTTVFRDRAD